MAKKNPDATTDAGRLIGYARVSSTDGRQRTDLQRDAPRDAGVTALFEDHCSGATTSRPDLDRRLAELRARETLMIWRLDRLGRKLPHLLEVVARSPHRGRKPAANLDNLDKTGKKASA